MRRYVVDAPTSEAMQLLLDEVRRGERTDAEALAAHTAMTELKMRLLGDRFDAEYLAIVRLQADALVTIDPRLATVAADLVLVAPLEDLLVPESGRSR